MTSKQMNHHTFTLVLGTNKDERLFHSTSEKLTSNLSNLIIDTSHSSTTVICWCRPFGHQNPRVNSRHWYLNITVVLQVRVPKEVGKSLCSRVRISTS